MKLQTVLKAERPPGKTGHEHDHAHRRARSERKGDNIQQENVSWEQGREAAANPVWSRKGSFVELNVW